MNQMVHFFLVQSFDGYKTLIPFTNKFHKVLTCVSPPNILYANYKLMKILRHWLVSHLI